LALRRQEAHQLLAVELARSGAEKLAQRPVGLDQTPVAIEKRDAYRRIGEEELEAQPRQPQRLLPFALGREVAHHRPGAQAVADLDHRLADRGVNGAALTAAQHDLAARRAGSAAFEGRMRGTARRRVAGEEVPEPRAAVDELARRGAKPVGERLVDE